MGAAALRAICQVLLVAFYGFVQPPGLYVVIYRGSRSSGELWGQSNTLGFREVNCEVAREMDRREQ